VISVGLDFGTSNSSVAVYDGTATRLIPLEPDAPEPTVLRSLLYVTRDGEQFVGQEAVDRHQRENAGRAVKLQRRYVGNVTMTFAGVGTITTETHALVDANEPGRLFQSIKTLLPDRMFKKTGVFGVDLTAEDLVALLAGEILRRTQAHLGCPVERLTVGRPVRFAADAAADALARERLREAIARLGVPVVTFLEEPVAAGVSYAWRLARDGETSGGTFAVFDFGGGTLDVTIARGRGQEADVLATGGVAVGGDILDRRIVQARMLRHFGESATFGAAHLPVPRHILARILDWQTLYLLNRPQTLSLIEELVQTGSQPRELRNLHTLVTRGYGAALFRAVELGKQRLSAAGHARIELLREDIAVLETLTREAFEAIIRDQFNAVEQCVALTTAEAGIDPGDVQAIVTTGGSSRIPLFRTALRRRYPNARLVEQDAFTSVASGLAIAGAAA